MPSTQSKKSSKSSKANTKILSLKIEEIHAKLISTLATEACYERDMVLPSGKIVNYDIDVANALMGAETGALASLAMLEKLDDTVEAVGGFSPKARAIASAMAQVALLQGRDLDAFLLRNNPKLTDNNKWIDGSLKAGQKVAIVHDTVVDGLKEIETVRQMMEQADVEVVQVIAFLDREDGSAQRLRDIGVDYTAICTMEEVLREVKAKNKSK